MEYKYDAYYGVEGSILEFASIMSYGILSQREAKNKGHYYRERKYALRTELDDDDITMAVKTNFGNLGELYEIVNGGISFVLKDFESDCISQKYSDIYVKGEIPFEKISGILINRDIRDKKISELSVLGSCAPVNICSNARMTKNFLIREGIDESEFDGIDDLINSYENFLAKKKIDDKIEENVRGRIDTILSRAIEKLYQRKLGKNDISVMDVVNYHNQERGLPIYDETIIGYRTNEGSRPSIIIRDRLQLQEQNSLMRLGTLLDKKAKLQGYRDIQDYRIRAKLGKEIPVESLDAETQQKIDEIQAQIDDLMKGKDK